MSLHEPIKGLVGYNVQKVLPAVYDDSLSYYELLAKMQDKVNELIQLANELNVDVSHVVETVANIDNIPELEEQVIALQEATDTIQNTLDSLPSYNQFLSLVEDVNDVEDGLTKKLPWPLSSGIPSYGSADKVLATNGDGSTKWVNPIEPTDQQAQTYITAWLNAHPEATTTVEDGAITPSKLSQESIDLIHHDSEVMGFCPIETAGYVNINTATVLDPSNYTPTASEYYKHTFIPVKKFDVVEICCKGTQNLRPYCIIAGDTYETPYSIILKATVYESANTTVHTYIVVTQDDAAYMFVQNNIVSNPNGFARKLSLENFRDELRTFDKSFYTMAYRQGTYMTPSGTSNNSEPYCMCPTIPLEKGDVLEVALSGTSNSSLMCIYDAEFNFIRNWKTGVSWDTITEISFTATEKCFVRMSYYNNLNAGADGLVTMAKRKFNLKSGFQYLSQSIIEHIEEPIVYLANASVNNSLNLLHVSDMHGDVYSLNRIKQTYDFIKEEGLADDAILTGDFVYQNYSNATDIFNCIPEGLFTIGNHEVRPSNAQMYKYTNTFTIADAYTKYFYNISLWDVETDNVLYPTYYYKDYADKGIRLICVDPIMNATYTQSELTQQLTWLDATLESARQASLNVVMICHYPTQGTPVFIDCGFTTYYHTVASHIGDSVYTESTMIELQDAVQTFIQNGGKFVCWLTGHNHHDNVFYTEEYPDQLCIVLGTGSTRVETGTYNFTKGVGRTMFNVCAIDTVRKHVRLVRFGNTSNSFMQNVKGACIDYDNKVLIGEI